MGTAIVEEPGVAVFENLSPPEKKRVVCDGVGKAVKNGNVGDIVAKHQELILQYYEDVQRYASESFKAAKVVASIGFAVLILTWIYIVGLDFAHVRATPTGMQALVNPPALFGTTSALLIEFIAGVNFWLYSKASKQFGAFHICLERTHRYLVAYKIGEETGSRREVVLEHLACIMASAPMITYQDIDAARPPARVSKPFPPEPIV